MVTVGHEGKLKGLPKGDQTSVSGRDHRLRSIPDSQFCVTVESDGVRTPVWLIEQEPFVVRRHGPTAQRPGSARPTIRMRGLRRQDVPRAVPWNTLREPRDDRPV